MSVDVNHYTEDEEAIIETAMRHHKVRGINPAVLAVELRTLSPESIAAGGGVTGCHQARCTRRDVRDERGNLE
jgi:hypothetical protein